LAVHGKPLSGKDQKGCEVPQQHIHPAGFRCYLFDINEQIGQDSIIAGNSIFKSLILEYAIITTNAAPNTYAPGSIPQVIFPPLVCMTPAQAEGMNTKR